MRDFDHAAGERDILLERQLRAVDHHRGEAFANAGAAFLPRVGVIDVQRDGNARGFGEGAKHLAQHRNRGVAAGARPRLQDDGQPRLFRRLDEGARILPALHDQTRDAEAAGHRQFQHLVERCDTHLNFAIMSLMPGMVSICQACAGWKNCTSGRWLRPERMVK